MSSPQTRTRSNKSGVRELVQEEEASRKAADLIAAKSGYIQKWRFLREDIKLPPGSQMVIYRELKLVDSELTIAADAEVIVL